MKQKQNNEKYEVWLSSEIMHNDSLKWLSELKFVKDEQLFFDDLVKSYTLQLIDSKYFTESKKIINQLSLLQKETVKLIEKIIQHEKGLKIMVDGINQIEEENAYRRKHTKFILIVNDFLTKNRILKTQLFSLIKSILKEGKQKRLLQ